MVFEHIEKLKRDYTDKYVVVDVSRPELQRFEGQTGLIKTVNMNGNALVEFDGLLNIGWYDIGLDFLKIVDKPLPKEAPKATPKKKPAAKAAAKPAAKPAAPEAGGKMSVTDMLAAARGEKGGAAAPPAKPAEKKEAPAKPTADAGKMSVADMLAAARGEKSGGAVAASPAPAAEPEPEVVPESATESAPAGDIPKDTPGILTYCRQVDGS